MKKEKKKSSFSTLMKHAGKRQALTYFGIALSCISALLALAPFIFIWLIIKEVLEVGGDFSQATHIVLNGWLAVVFAVGSALIYFAALMCTHLAAFRVATNMRIKTLSHVTKLPIGVIDTVGTGKMRKIIGESAAATETYLAHQLPDMAGAIVTPIAMLVLLFVFDWRLGLLSLVPIVSGFIVMFRMAGPTMRKDMEAYQNAMDAMNNEAVEYVRGIPVVKTFGQTVYSFKKFKGTIDDYEKFCIAYTKKCCPHMIAFTVLINSVYAFLISFALIITHGGIEQTFILNLLFYIIFTPIIATTLNKVMYMSENVMMVEDALNRVNIILSLSPLKEPASPQTPKDNSIEFSNVVFRYDGAVGNALDGVTLKIPANSVVAFVGESGGGKTTAASLIAQFWDTTEGSVKIGGVDVKDIGSKNINNLVSFVFQSNRLFKTTIAENVKISNPKATDEEVLTALHSAQCDDIIAKFKDGVNTVIGTKGVYLSGGEQQRIAIARAMLKNSPIVILDEATAFADPENEILVQKAFEKLSENKTVILIAHRLSTVRNADKIFALKEGKLAESGTHEILKDCGGEYEKMWKEYQTSIGWKVGGNI